MSGTQARLGHHLWFSPHGTEWRAVTYEKALEMERDALAAELERVTAALRDLREAAGDYHQGCECGGSGVITACSGRDTEGCCGACERTACEVCPDLLVALYQADAALAGGARAAQDDYENRKHEDRL
jgi:hypothetical protein